jgi:peptide deformylase
MILPIVQAGGPVLRQPARPLRQEEILSAEIRELIDNMKETMRNAPGVGLAAPQVGLGLQLAVIEDRSEYTKEWTPEQVAQRERRPIGFHVIINPKLTAVNGRAEFFEGCLSLAGLMALVPRAREVTVECLDEHGLRRAIQARGWYARILQHEIDHLAGNIYVDRMLPRTLMTVENYKKFWLERGIPAVISELVNRENK